MLMLALGAHRRGMGGDKPCLHDNGKRVYRLDISALVRCGAWCSGVGNDSVYLLTKGGGVMVQKYVGPSALISELDTLKIQQHDKREYVLYKDYATIEAENAVLREKVKRLAVLARRYHTEGENPYYPCPKSPSGKRQYPNGGDCNCDADEHNAKVDRILEQARKEVE